MIKEITVYAPARTVDCVFRMEEGEFFDDLRELVSVTIDQIFWQEGEKLLFYVSKLASLQIIQVELFSESEDFALYVILFVPASS